eukprot:jgi/Mesvir1/19170/Mv01190-RA.2
MHFCMPFMSDPEAAMVSKDAAPAAVKRNALAIITNIAPAAADDVLIKPFTTKPRTKRAARVNAPIATSKDEESKALEAPVDDASIPAAAPGLQAEKSAFDVGVPIDDAILAVRPPTAMLAEVCDHEAFPEGTASDYEETEDSDDACDDLCSAIQGLSVANNAMGVHTRFVDDEDGNVVAVKSPRNMPLNQHIRFGEDDDETVVIKTPKA